MDYMPFTYKVVGQEEEYKVDYKSLITNAVIAIATGLVMMFATQSALSEKLEAISDQVSQIKKTQDQFQRDFYMPKR